MQRNAECGLRGKGNFITKREKEFLEFWRKILRGNFIYIYISLFCHSMNVLYVNSGFERNMFRDGKIKTSGGSKRPN